MPSRRRWPARRRRCSCCRGTLNHFAKDLGVPLDLAEAALLVRDGEPAHGRRRRGKRARLRQQLLDRHLPARRRAARAAAGGEAEAASGRPCRVRRCARSAASRRCTCASPPPTARSPRDAVRVRRQQRRRRRGRQAPASARVSTRAAGRGHHPRRRRGARPWPSRCGALGRLDDAGTVWQGEPAELTVDTAAASQLVSLDGEVVSGETPLAYRSRPGALVVLVP